MKKVAIVCRKGGSGKSTTAINLAIVAQASGKNCRIVDLDDQGTSTDFTKARKFAPPEVEMANPKGMDFLLERISSSCDLAIIDTPGELTGDEYFSPADLILIPTRINDADTNALGETLALVQASGIPFAIVLNQVRPGYNTKKLEEKWRQALEVPIAGTVCLRADFEKLDDGRGAIERNPNGAAAKEIVGIYEWMMGALEHGIG